jgi:hypothetical protein
MSHPVSPKQLAANRANAAKSTGPRTPAGKHHSARNARKHGFTGSTFAVVSLKDLREVAQFKQDLVTVYQPVNSEELLALDRVALAQHAILRAARQSHGLSLLLRYQARAERRYHQAIDEFKRLMALRQEFPNEPIFEARPQQTEPACPF